MTRWFNAPLELHRRWIETKKSRTKSKEKKYIDGRYKLLQEIGQGASGIVHLALDIKTNTQYAIKELNKSRLQRQFHSELLRQSGPAGRRIRQNSSSSDDSVILGVSQSKKRKLNDNEEQKILISAMMIEEIEILKSLPQHENVIKFINVVEDEESIFIVTELAEKGVVMDVVPHSISKPYSEDECRNIFKQLAYAVDHLHQNNIVHRDIKPQNLIMSNDCTVKLIDFGNATKISDISRRTNNSVGSPAFMAPELLKKGTKEKSDSPTCADLWSMGITLYCLAYGKLPFETSSLLDLYNDIQNKSVIHSDNIDPTLCDLINKLLEKNPKDRISMKDLKAHPWMQKK